MKTKATKKKAILIPIVVAAVLAIGTGLALFLTRGFTQGRITGRVYNVQNVYDELWNLLKREEYGQQTVLTGSDPTASKVFELGVFDYLSIPACGATLNNRSGTLWIHINTGESMTGMTGGSGEKVVSYEYDTRTKTLKIYGSEDENCLIEQFLTRYFAWRAAENAGTEYSLDDTGDYSVRVMYVDN